MEENEFYNSYQDQFTFLVFDRSKVEDFFATYPPLDFNNLGLVDTIQNTFESVDFTDTFPERFKLNAREPFDQKEFDFTQKLIKSTSEDEEAFHTGLEYFFYYKCLPNEFQAKWFQGVFSQFEFNSTFFELLRKHSSTLDGMIYSEISTSLDPRLHPIFGEFIVFEITPEAAEKIKKVIMNHPAFEDERFILHKKNFLYFLDKAITEEWMLLLHDWN